MDNAVQYQSLHLHCSDTSEYKQFNVRIIFLVTNAVITKEVPVPWARSMPAAALYWQLTPLCAS